ncbi:ATP-binding protein [uncultured Thiodictyon sp.]|uniref:AAA family ATPase n=1 Tax=uncultured Thiodictyon sp. TaxID=1846217 RepID=UPI0025FFFE6F|nr:ATP-binding protein [uncultured Thiodictyon sp.]
MARTLGRLGQVAQDAHLVLHSRSPRERNGALNRAIGALKYLQGNLDACPQPERAVVEKIVNQWLDLALGVATDVGTLEAREPIASPYIVGAPVPADRLVGRESVYEQIRSAWVKTGQRDSLVVYGHRRMGKTSVMKNLLDFCPMGEDTGLAFLNLQTVDWSEPLPDLCQAIAFELWRAAGSDRPEPQPDAFASNPLAALRTFLAGLNAAPPQRRFILVLDEYELLDERLPPEAGTRFVELLRGLTQQYPWLVIALVGLHSLKERSASFYQAIFAWRPVRIGFLDVGGLADCLEVQDDAFPLAYDPEAVAAVHRLTGGQPFLVQLLGDGLVQGFNRRLREEIRPPASRFTAADVAALTETGDLFTQGAAYFLGIWGQAGVGAPGQQGVLRALAPSADGLDAAGLAQASGLGEADLAAALRALVDHDVLAHRGGRWGFTVELMRRWVAAGQMDLEPGAPA